jgi:hypothetical protein
MLAWLMRDFRTILISNMIFGKLHGAIVKLCRAFCEHAHGAGALYQISRSCDIFIDMSGLAAYKKVAILDETLTDSSRTP